MPGAAAASPVDDDRIGACHVVCIYVYVYMCTYHVYIQIDICIHTEYVCLYVCIYLCIIFGRRQVVCRAAVPSMFAQTYIHTQIHTYMHIRIYRHTLCQICNANELAEVSTKMLVVQDG